LTPRELQRTVRRELSQRHRYGHTLRVARLAGSLARAHGEEPAAAVQAAMLHDLARLHSTDALVAECERRELPIDRFERANPIVLHARLGAELARESFGITDERVLEAIRAHTLGAPAMSRIAQIVYLADSLEPGRDFPEREEQHQLAITNLDAATLAVLEANGAYQRRLGHSVAPQSVAAIEWYARKIATTQPATTPKEKALCRA
jgi:predicted HD superfamily hydrolase involved in NAD metabolism